MEIINKDIREQARLQTLWVVVHCVCAMREAKNMQPTFATFQDLLTHEKDCLIDGLNKLCEQGKLIRHKTLNGESYEIPKELINRTDIW